MYARASCVTKNKYCRLYETVCTYKYVWEDGGTVGLHVLYIIYMRGDAQTIYVKLV